MPVSAWWARQGLNLRPHPCEGSYIVKNSGNASLAERTDRDSSENIAALSDHNLTTLSDEPLLFDEMEVVPVEATPTHQSQLPPAHNKFHVGNGDDGKHYWLTPPSLYASLHTRFNFDFDPCPYPRPEGFDGLTCEWGKSSYANIPFGSVMHQGPEDKKPRKKGPTAWVRKALAEHAKGKRVVMVYPVDKWLLMLLSAGAKVENLGDVRWCATEDGSAGKGTGRHIACFILEPSSPNTSASGVVG